MVSKNGTNDYVVLRGPSRIDPNVYKIATLLIFSFAVIALVIIQICRKKYLQRFKMCRCYYKDSAGVDARDTKKISMQSTSCPSSNRSEIYRKPSEKTAVEDPAREIHLPMLEPVPVQSTDDGNVATRSPGMVSFQVGEDPEKIEMAVEQLIENSCASCIPTSSASEYKFAKHHESQTRPLNQTELQISNLDASNSLSRRKRRSAVCVSMPRGQDLPETSRSPSPRRSEDVWKRGKQQVNEDVDGLKDVRLQKNQTCLPELQLNGETYKHDKHEPKSNDNFSKVEDMGDDAADEGQLQCVVKYDEKQSILNLKSIIVRTTMDPGVPGFLVEASLLPRRSVSVKSKVYLSAQREVDLTINEVFNLRCSAEDIETNSLFIAVKPMFSNVILFAETELRDLSLSHEKEVMLGGNLKSLSTNLS